jgi:hypothetical protein
VDPVKEHVNWSATTEAKRHKATAAGTAVAVQATGDPGEDHGNWSTPMATKASKDATAADAGAPPAVEKTSDPQQQQ